MKTMPLPYLLGLFLVLNVAALAPDRQVAAQFPLPADAASSPLVSFNEFGIAAVQGRAVVWRSASGEPLLSTDLAQRVRLVRIIGDRQLLVVTDSALWLFTILGPDHFTWWRTAGTPDRFLVDQVDSPRGFHYRAPDGTVSRIEFPRVP